MAKKLVPLTSEEMREYSIIHDTQARDLAILYGALNAPLPKDITHLSDNTRRAARELRKALLVLKSAVSKELWGKWSPPRVKWADE